MVGGTAPGKGALWERPGQSHSWVEGTRTAHGRLAVLEKHAAGTGAEAGTARSWSGVREPAQDAAELPGRMRVCLPDTGRPTHVSPPRRAAVAADLQVGDVSVDAHGGRHAVLGHVLVVAGARLAVHSVHTGDGDPLVASSDVSATGEGTLPSCDKCRPTGTGLGRVSQLRRSRPNPDALPQQLGASPAHRPLRGHRPVRGRVSKCLARLQRVPHLGVEAGALQGRLSLLVFQVHI